MDLSFSVHKLAKFSATPGKVQFEGFVHILRYIRENKTLGLKYYSDMNDTPVSYLLQQASIKTKNQLMDFNILVGKIEKLVVEHVCHGQLSHLDKI